MSTVIIVALAVIFVVIVASLMVGRTDYEVESARDTEFVELEGHWIRYNVIGGGPPVILVHGWLLSSRIWEQLARRLAQRFTVYTLDLTGFGESDKPTSGYGVRYGSRLLYSFCAHFGIARAGVIAHDLGGDMAVKLAADHPDIVGRLVLVATPADDSQIDLPTALWLTTLPVVGPLFFMLGRLFRPVRRLWMRHFVLDPKDLPEEALEDPAQTTPAAASKTLNVTRTEISGSRLLRQAGIIKVPVLLVAGEQDRIVDSQAVSDWGQSITQAEIALLDNCGHLPMVERTGELGARILAFLTGDERYMDYARETPSAVPEPPAEQEVREPDEEEVVANDPDDSDKAVAASEPEKPTAPGELRWEFDVGDKARPRKVIRPKLNEDPYRETLKEEEGDDVSRSQGSQDGSLRKPPSIPRHRDEGAQEEAPSAPEGPLPTPEDTEGREESQPRPRREASGAGRIPEFPGDLFQWSEKPRQPRSRRTPRNRPEESEDFPAEADNTP
jgi:pimeloyl-ACP methyl ester carboxylesterase